MRKTLVLLTIVGSVGAAWADQTVWEQVFGDAGRMDPAMRAKVLEDEPGKRHYVDADKDGRPEEVWFIDLAKRHPEQSRPLLVRVIDEDGDLEMGHEPDLDSDLYVADWKADGTIDCATDYTDEDGDQDVDAMGFYFPAGDTLRCWWGLDIGDDNLLWYDEGYTYSQRACQYRCHFGGDELFCAYRFIRAEESWLPQFENPFCFYDRDHDGITEEVIRIEGEGPEVYNLRYSFDVDNDATLDNPRDFDVSISAHAPEGLEFPPELGDARTLRGFPCGAFIAYDKVQEYARHAPWTMRILTWDENDLNCDGDGFKDGTFADPQERWEGVIAKGNEYFKQIGGPSCGVYNKRYEVDLDPQGPLEVYCSDVDHRFHLRGADHAWLLCDLDYDQQADARYDYLDTDNDGYIDTWRFDADADGTVDWEWQGEAATAYTWGGVSKPPAQEGLDHIVAALLETKLAQAGIAVPEAWGATSKPLLGSKRLAPEVYRPLVESEPARRYACGVLCDRLVTLVPAELFQDEAPAWREARRMRRLDLMLELLEPAAWPETPVFAPSRPSAPGQVAWAEDWVPPNIGWENTRCAYRAYWGQFDFFGKREPCLIMPRIHEIGNYHAEQDWGMDALHAGATGGLGGVTLYLGGQAYPVYSPEGEGPITWSKELVRCDAMTGPSTQNVMVRLRAQNAGPAEAPLDVTFTCSLYEGFEFTQIALEAAGPVPDDAEIGLGMTKLGQEAFTVAEEGGFMASWGIQDPAIGWVGLALACHPSLRPRYAERERQHELVVPLDAGAPIRYRVQGDWLRGHRFTRCPGLKEWVDHLTRARALRGPATIDRLGGHDAPWEGW